MGKGKERMSIWCKPGCLPHAFKEAASWVSSGRGRGKYLFTHCFCVPLFKAVHILFPVPLQRVYVYTANKPQASHTASPMKSCGRKEKWLRAKALSSCVHGKWWLLGDLGVARAVQWQRQMTTWRQEMIKEGSQ